jgi:hypothetical protein
MDGGRVCRAILAHYLGLLRGTEIAVRVGVVVAFLVAFGMMAYSVYESHAMTGRLSFPNPMPLVIAGVVAMVGPMELRALRYREQQKREAQQLRSYLVSTEPLPYKPLPYPDEEETNSAAPPPAPRPEIQPGFSGYTWDGEFGVWVKWQNGRRVAAYWNGPE